MEKRKIILDCDPGHDDAVAIILAGKDKNIDLLGITVTSGNQTLEKTSVNAFNVCKYLDINVPIALGADHPFIREVEVCAEIHGESGLDGFTFPQYEYHFDSRKAANFIIDTLKANDKVTIVTTGPMTNLALAIRLDSSILSHIEEVIFMGGSMINGNVTPAAEFNILCDPEAAYIVLNSGLKVKMVGLDVTRKVKVTEELIEEYRKINTKASDLFVKLMEVFVRNQKNTFNFDGAPLHDPATIVSLIDPKCITFKKMNVEIDLSHMSSYGRTNCDIFNYLKKTPNCDVAIDIDVERYFSIVKSHLMDE